MATHEVMNQAPPLVGADPAQAPVIMEALRRVGVGDAAIAEVSATGAFAGSEEAIALGDLAEAHPRSCAPTIATGTGSTRSSTTRRTTD